MGAEALELLAFHKENQFGGQGEGGHFTPWTGRRGYVAADGVGRTCNFQYRTMTTNVRVFS